MDTTVSPLFHFRLLSDFVQELYQLPAALLQNEEDLAAFCRHHCFRPVQWELTAHGLSTLFAQTDEKTVFHITDSLGIHLFLFQIERIPAILGPFCTLIFSQKDARTLLSENHIEDAVPQDFLSYSSRYPCLTENQAIRLVRTFLHNLYPAEEDRGIIPILPAQVAKTPVESDPVENRPSYAMLLEQRHACETGFRRSIAEGNQKDAVANLERMQQDVSYLKRIGSTLENEKIGSAIVRTIARLAAMDSGLPGIVADRISSQNTKDIQRARTVDEIALAKKRMVRDYCAAIRSLKENRYSALVQSVLYEMERSYHKDISLADLAAELAVSKNYLIKRFHTETGMTPVQYLTSLRMKKAALLLEKRSMSVQEISSAVGIPDSNYFTKLFKKAYQMTPAEYRKKKLV